MAWIKYKDYATGCETMLNTEHIMRFGISFHGDDAFVLYADLDGVEQPEYLLEGDKEVVEKGFDKVASLISLKNMEYSTIFLHKKEY